MALESRPARLAVCRKCGGALVIGLAEGLRSVADAVACTLLGEYVARISKRESYELRYGELQYRDLSRITAQREIGPILVQHKCGYPIPPEYRARIKFPEMRSEDSADEFPF